MTVEMPDDLDGFITRDGEFLSIRDVDGMLSFITKRTENRDEVRQMLEGLACECADKGYFDSACAYLEYILPLADTSEEKARVLLAMGQLHERSGDYKAALDPYFRAFEYPQQESEVWYFLHNNVAYCLNLADRHQEAEIYCRAAIRIDEGRHHAHKNLGIALQGLQRYCEAARSFARAACLCPADTRALELLDSLITSHGEILKQGPDIVDSWQRCHEVAPVMGRKCRMQ
jgi:tetratricopeptide (TPR) repeat protein